jgi:drug/metabolite transporter (DMT)-like permease
MSLYSWTLLMCLSMIWGASFYFIEVGLTYLSPAWLVCVRLLTGAAFLSGWLFLSNRFLPMNRAFWGAALVMGIFNNLIPFFLIAWGQQFVTGGMASIINANTAFFGVIVSAIFLRSEPLKLNRVCGVIIGVIGVAVAIGIGEGEKASAPITGSLAILLATLSYALAGVWGKRFLSPWPAQYGAAAMLICSALISVPFAYMHSGLPSMMLFQPENIVALTTFIMGIGVLGTALAYPLYFMILANAGASNLMLVTIIVPVFALILDATLLGQWVDKYDILGFILVAIGLAIMDGRLVPRR